MVENVGAIEFTVDADTGQLIASIKQVDQQSAKLETRLTRVASAVKKVTSVMKAGATVITAAVAAIGAVAAASAKAAKEMSILARQAGVGVEEFQGLAFAARSVGIEQDKLADIFKDSQDKVGDFLATGGGELKDFFETIAPQIGLTAEEFRGLSGPAILGKFQQALDGANLSASEQIFFLESLADEASRLQPLLTDNSAALNEQTKRFNELNLALTQVEIDALDELSGKFSVLGDTIRLKTASAIAFFAEEIGGAIEFVTDGISSLSNVFRKLFAQFGIESKTAMTEVKEDVAAVKEESEKPVTITVSTGESTASLEAFKAALVAVTGEMDITAEKADRLNQKFGETFRSAGLSATQAAAELGDTMGNALVNVGNSLADVAARAIVMNESFEQGVKSVGQALLTEILSSLIKVGARLLINQAIAATATTAAVASGAAAASATAAAWAAPAALVSSATFGANAAPAQAGLLATAGTAQLIAAAGRQQGGPVSAGGVFRVNEGGSPEVFTEGGRQFLIPNTSGQVVSNADASAGQGATQVTINVANSAQARVDVGQVTQSGGALTIDVAVSDIRSGNGPLSRAFAENTNLTRKTQ
jgi:hypothetical protein